MILGDYWPNPDRWERVDFTPAWWRTGFASLKDPESDGPDISTLEEASNARATVCALQDSAIVSILLNLYPKLVHHPCGPTVDECAAELKTGACALFPWDELTLGYFIVSNPELVLTKERVKHENIIWPLRRGLNSTTVFLINKWLYMANFNTVLDDLYQKYYSVQLCPIGFSGENCDQHCDPNHGRSNRLGECTCDSTRYTGKDCSIEVPPDLHLIPLSLKIVGYVFFGINALAVVLCFLWIYYHRRTTKVAISQPFFLNLVLLGCIISSTTILTLGQEDSDDGVVVGCMLSPWLYSVGFCITFGTLYAKIRRVKELFEASGNYRRTKITVADTLFVIGKFLLLDITLLVVWTIVDPLEWQRDVLTSDNFGYVLSSVGYCSSEHWKVFTGAIAGLHFCLLGFASFICYGSRHINSQFSEGNVLSIAMISNFQIFLVGVPVLIIAGTDPATSYFLRIAIIWINDFMVVALIFGSLIHSVHFDGGIDATTSTASSMISRAVSEHRVGRNSVSRFSATPSVVLEEPHSSIDLQN